MEHKEEAEIQTPIHFAAIQTVSETGIGSVLHQMRVPLSGQILSLNQIFLLSWAAQHWKTHESRFKNLNFFFTLAASMKAFSPMGKRLTPMLAIQIQGFIFTLAVTFFRFTILGVFIGSLLAGIWAFVQPITIAYILMGDTLLQSIQSLWMEFQSKLGLHEVSGITILSGFVLLKVILSVCVALLGWLNGQKLSDSYIRGIKKLVPQNYSFFEKPVSQSKMKIVGLTVKDLLSPFFLFTSLLCIYFFVNSGTPTSTEITVYVLRIFVGGFLVFSVLRGLFFNKHIEKIRQNHRLLEVSDAVAKLRSRTDKS